MVIHYHVYRNLAGHAMAQAFISQPLTMQAKVESQANPCGTCGGKSGSETGFSPHTSSFPYHYLSTNARYPSITNII
jgi:hypothetical protein